MAASFLPDVRAEQDFVARTTQRFKQLDAYSRSAHAADLAGRVSDHYRKYPWTTPGIAVAFAKWKEEVGPRAAKALARVAFESGGDQDAIEQYAMTKEFQRQVKEQKDGGGGGFWGAVSGGFGMLGDALIGSAPVVGPLYSGTKAVERVTGENAIEAGQAAVGSLPGVGPGLKGASRAGFTALESPYQEVQAGLTNAVTGFIGPVGDQAQPAPPGSEASRMGAVSGAPEWRPTSTGAIALGKVAAGEPVDLGTGWLPGGEVRREHEAEVRKLASFTYGTEPVLDDDGKPVLDSSGQPKTRPATHFATPGRIVASSVTEPGTIPFNALSGVVDAAAIVTLDPANKALAAVGRVNQARRGFDLTRPASLEQAGGLRNAWRTFTHGPAVQQYLDGEAGQRATRYFAGQNDFLKMARDTNWKLPADTYVKLVDADDSVKVRSILEPVLGIAVENQPNPFAFGAAIRSSTQPYRIWNLRPQEGIDLRQLDGESGALANIYRYMKNAKVPDERIGPILHDVAAAKSGFGQYAGLNTSARVVSEVMQDRGVPRGIADEVTHIFANDLGKGSQYWIDQIGHDAITPGVVIDGRAFPTDLPHLFVEAMNPKVYLPSTGTVNKTFAKYGRILNIKGTGAVEEGGRLSDAALWGKNGLYRSDAFLTHLQSTLWVPLTLLRGAWTVRVIGEEQLRLAAAGMHSMFRHPIAHLNVAVGQKGGLVDDNLMDSLQGQAALSRDASKFVGDAGQKVVARGKTILEPGMERFHRSWADELIKEQSDDVAREVARAVRNPTAADGAVGVLDDVKARFWDGDLSQVRLGFSESPNHMAVLDFTTREGSDAYIETVYARLHEMTRGHGPLVDFVASGRYGDEAAQRAGQVSLSGRQATWPSEMQDEVGTIVAHKAGASQARVLFPSADEPITVSLADLSVETGGKTRAVTMAHDGFSVDRKFVDFLKTMPEGATPSRVVGDVVASASGEQFGILDSAVRHLFSVLMARPTNWLSRSPAFKQFYWNRVGKLMSQADAAAQGQILEGAERVGLSRSVRKMLQRASDDAVGGDLLVEDIDTIAKGFALDSVRDLLYDLNRRSQFFEATRLIFPFGEAWKEVLTRWAKLGVERPQVIRGFQIGITEARQANPFSLIPGAVPDQYAQQGFFFKDPTTQEESFAYPWSHQLNEALMGVPIPYGASAKGLNLAMNLMPGVGPVMQFGASAFLNRYMTDPKWDPVRELVSPYGTPDMTAGLEAWAPSWMKKWLTAYDIGGEQDARLLNNTIMEVFAYGVSVGDYSTHSEAAIERGLADAEKKARTLYKVRGTFQSVAPSAPSPRFVIEAKGKLVQLSVLRDEYQRLMQKDPSTATAKFLSRFGEDAFYATGAMTTANAYAIPVTKSGLDWERNNPQIREKFPTIYGFFAPAGKPEEFDYTAYLRSITTGARTPIDPKEWVRRSNNVLGSLWYDRARTKMGLEPGDTGSAEQRTFLAGLRDEIRKYYPGWADISIEPNKTGHAVEQLAKAAKDPQLKKSNPGLTTAIRLYEQARQKGIESVIEDGGTSEFGRPGYGEANKFLYIRDWLRDIAADIEKRHPAFATVFDQVYSNEFPREEG